MSRLHGFIKVIADSYKLMAKPGYIHKEVEWTKAKLVFNRDLSKEMMTWPVEQLTALHRCGAIGYSLEKSVEISHEYHDLVKEIHNNTILNCAQAIEIADEWLEDKYFKPIRLNALKKLDKLSSITK